MAWRSAAPYLTLLVLAVTCQAKAVSTAHGRCLLALRNPSIMSNSTETTSDSNGWMVGRTDGRTDGSNNMTAVQGHDDKRQHLAASAQIQLAHPDSYNCWSDPIHEPSTAFGLMLAGIGVMVILACCLRWLGHLPHAADGNLAVKRDHQPSAKSKIQTLEWLRVLLIAVVVWFHAYGSFYGFFPGDELYRNGPMGYFTILAGFVRTVSIGDLDTCSLDSLTSAAKVIARFGPAYWTALILLFLLVDYKEPLVAWPVQAVFLQAFFPVCMEAAPYKSFPLAGNMVAWFVSAIFIPTLFFPAAFRLLCWFGTNRQRSHALAGLLLVFVLRSYLVVYIGSAKNAYVRGCEFYIGMLLGQICSLQQELLLSWPHWTWFSNFSLLAALVIPYLLDQIGVIDQIGVSNISNSNGLILFWCLFITSAWAADNAKTLKVKCSLFDLIPLVPLAKYCYGAYIYTFVARAVYDRIYPGEVRLEISAGVVFALAWVMAAFSYHLIEGRLNF